jgi:hypothetical protein
MANTISSDMMTQGASSTSQLEAREVGDEVRYLGYGQAPFTNLIQNSVIDNATGKIKQSKGLISKRAVKNIKFEQFNRSPAPNSCTVASGTEISSSGIVVADANGVIAGYTLFNAANNTRARIESVSGTTVKGSSFGATTFSCSAGDKLVLTAPAVKAGSDAPIIANGTDDNTFNTLQFSRLGVSATWVLQAVKQLAGGERLPREKLYLLWEFLRLMENSMILGDMTASYASKNTTTGVQTGWVDEYPTTKGLLANAARGYDMLGQITLEKIRKNLALALGDTINDNQPMIAFCGNDLYARIQELFQDKHYNTEGEGELAKFGVKCYNIVTSGPMIKLVKHSTFNIKGLDNQMLVFAPENIGYVYLEGHDVSPNNGIQDNDTHGVIDELYAYFGIETKDGGKSICSVTNCF